MVHSKAMTLYRRGDLGRAVKRLDGFFDHHDYRRIDPTGTDSSYTMILEDFAFFLLKSKGDFSWTRELLAYVLTRDPERATAHLNLGDLLYRDASTLERRPGELQAIPRTDDRERTPAQSPEEERSKGRKRDRSEDTGFYLSRICFLSRCRNEA